MGLRILVAPDKLKATLAAEPAARALATGWLRGRPGDHPTLLPISDGGDGFGELVGKALQAEEREIPTVDAAGRPVIGKFWWVEAERLAIIESARVIGLALLPPGQYHPFELDTTGLAQVLTEAARLRPKRCIIGIGGSATNDGGFGFAQALGWKFLAPDGHQITRWTELAALSRIAPPEEQLALGKVQIAVDVQNPLLGPIGASRVYGPQKGLRSPDFAQAEACLAALARQAQDSLGWDQPHDTQPGSGAAGGLGFGLHAFLGGELVSGFGLFAAITDLKGAIREADIVLTGEGSIDRTTIEMGKGVGGLAALCRKERVPCLGFAGSVDIEEEGRRAFDGIWGIVPELANRQQAMQSPAYYLEILAEKAARAWNLTSPPC
jgi:glycerate kinase